LEGNDTLKGGVGNDFLQGFDGDDTLDGGLGNDTLNGESGNDLYIVDSATDVVSEGVFLDALDKVQASISYTLTAGVEILDLMGIAANGTGNGSANTLNGNAAANILDGAGGADAMTGGLGNDTYKVDNALDTITEASALATEIDLVLSAVSYTIGTNVENLTLNLGSAAVLATGNASKNTLIGNALANTLDGLAGADTMSGGAGSDTYKVDNALDIVTESVVSTLAAESDKVESSVSYTLGANVENLTLSGAGVIGVGNASNNIIIGNTTLANTLSGAAGKDSLTGGSANDTLDGGLDNDTMVGGTGNDTYKVDNALDVITETSTLAAEVDTVESTVSYTLAANLEKLTLTGAGLINGKGNALENYISGNSGVNILEGGVGTGVDTLAGAAGNDIYNIKAATDVISETGTAATELDSVFSDVSYTLAINVENMTLNTAAGAANATGNASKNTLTGNTFANTLDGAGGADIMIGGTGNDIYKVNDALDIVTESSTLATEIDTVESTVSYTLSANVEKLILSGAGILGVGNAAGNQIVGNTTSANTLSGLLGNDTLTGGTLNDTLDGGDGNDTLDGGGGNDSLKGSTGNDTLTGGTGDDLLDGGIGNDSLVGGVGNDKYLVDSTTDIISEAALSGTDIVEATASYSLSAEIENLTLIGSAAINATGNGSNNTLTGNTGANILDGGLGADTLIGGAGNDTYIIGTGDAITESSTVATEIDTVKSSISYTLAVGSNLENLTLVSAAGASTAMGNELKNLLTGNEFVNTLNGGLGIDTMAGGAGADIYVVDNALDVVTEFTSTVVGEIDTIQSTISYTLSINVEKLDLSSGSATIGAGNAIANTIIGNGSANSLLGNDGNDTLQGDAGNDTLNGGIGIDSMTGGDGADIYVVDVIGDSVVETNTSTLAAEIDTVQSSISYTLTNNVENLTLTGFGVLNGTGNAQNNSLVGSSLDNILYGLAGNDTIDGGVGADIMDGGAGADSYYVDNSFDAVVENTVSTLASEMDIVYSSVEYALSFNIEKITLTGAANIGAVGNSMNNTMVGNGSANYLQGEGGNDTLTGGGGSDQFIFVAPISFGIDTITDFQTSLLGADKLVIYAANFAPPGFATDLLPTGLTAAQLTIGTAATTVDHRFIYNSGTGALSFDFDGSATTHGAIQFATLSTGLSLTTADFTIQ
jgi:serralysin